jgi:hypothetical protein
VSSSIIFAVGNRENANEKLLLKGLEKVGQSARGLKRPWIDQAFHVVIKSEGGHIFLLE